VDQALTVGDCSFFAQDSGGLTLVCEPNARLRIDVIQPSLLRVRLTETATFAEAALCRYGFVRDDWPATPFRLVESDTALTLSTEALQVRVERSPCRLAFEDATGRGLTRECREPGRRLSPGFRAQFELAEGEHLVGLGDQTRERIEHRGHSADMWIENVTSYAPVPFLMSSRGYGILVNTTWRHRFDVGETRDDTLTFEGARGGLDYYVFVGDSFREILDLYTQLTGRATLPPLWSFGLWFISRTQADCKEFLDDCLNFRRAGMPCDAISLEPGWMSRNYDFSVDKDWHPERFPVPSYAQRGPTNFLDAARRLGFKPGLWLCNDYDLTWEEGRRLDAAHAAADGAQASADGHEVDEHLRHGVRMDKLTKPAEPWFKHLKKFVDQGVEYFKQDGANQVLPHPDRKWANGMDDEELHNLYPLLYSRQMHQGFRDYTGRRATGFTPCGWTGFQRWTGTWSGDTGGGPGPLCASLNLSLCGHVYSTCDMEVNTKQGIHFGFLQPWAQVNSWNYWRHPWLLGDELKPVFMDYARLRYRLLPYLYSAGHEAYRTGMPILRAMPLDFPDDERSYTLTTQYMLGPGLLVGAFREEIHLPAGQWLDYWTGERHVGPKDFAPEVPPNRGGPLFVRAGALIPLAPVMDYVGQKPWDPIVWEVYPGGNSTFALYEDDGTTYAYEDGEVAVTELACSESEGRIALDLRPRQGAYRGMLRDRSFLLTIHCVQPAEVVLNAKLLPERETEGELHGAVCGWAYDESCEVLWVKLPRNAGEGVRVEVQLAN